jgi:hypothetical protein
MRHVSVERAMELLEYRPETGLLFWKVKPARRIVAGSMAGSIRHDGYVQIRIDGIIHYAHRVAYALMTGSWPADEIDHKDRNPSNNKWDNLRAASRAQNAVNVTCSKPSRSGLRGVAPCPDSAKWMARIRRNGKTCYLGAYDTPELAHAAYAAEAARLHGEFARVA